MDLVLAPFDRETGEVFPLVPDMLKGMENDDLANLTIDLKKLNKLKNEAEKEIKERLDNGQVFTKASYSNPKMTKYLVLDEGAKKALIKKYGWDSVVPLSLKQLQDKFGEEVVKDLEPYTVMKPQKPSIKWS